MFKWPGLKNLSANPESTISSRASCFVHALKAKWWVGFFSTFLHCFISFFFWMVHCFISNLSFGFMRPFGHNLGVENHYLVAIINTSIAWIPFYFSFFVFKRIVKPIRTTKSVPDCITDPYWHHMTRSSHWYPYSLIQEDLNKFL